VQVIHVRRWQQPCMAFDRRRGRAFTVQAEVERGHHLVFRSNPG